MPQPWTRVRHWVADLALEVSAGAVDGSLAPLDEDRLWVAADDRIRLLDWSPVGATAAPSAAADFASAQRFLYGVALGALRGIDPRAAAQEPPAVPLPLSARAFLLKLRDSAFSSPDVLATEASDLLRGAAVFARGRRAAQIAICAFLPVIMPAAVVSAIRVQRNLETSNVRAFEFNACVGQLADYKRRGKLLTAEQKERQRLIEIFIAEYLQDETREAAAVARTFPIITRNRSDHVLAEQAIARHPTRSREDVKRAERVVANLRQLESTSLTQLRTPLAQWGLAVFMTVWSCAFVACLSLVGALLVRGGFTIRGAGAALVTSRGDVAGRPRALWRALVTWLPIVPPLVLIAYGARVQDANLPLVVAQTLSLSILAAGAVWAILRPSHAYQDRIAGTWIVPR